MLIYIMETNRSINKPKNHYTLKMYLIGRHVWLHSKLSNWPILRSRYTHRSTLLDAAIQYGRFCSARSLLAILWMVHVVSGRGAVWVRDRQKIFCTKNFCINLRAEKQRQSKRAANHERTLFYGHACISRFLVIFCAFVSGLLSLCCSCKRPLYRCLAGTRRLS